MEETIIWKKAKPPIAVRPSIPVAWGSPPLNKSVDIDPSKKAKTPVIKVKKCDCPHSLFISLNWNFHSLRIKSTVLRSGCRSPNFFSSTMSFRRNGIESCSSEGRLMSTTISSAMVRGGSISL